MMHVLILTQYFPPEIGAPQNRLYDLAVKFQERGVMVSVLTAFPNYPKYEIFSEYRGRFFHVEDVAGMKIYRAWIFASKKKSVIYRLLNYFSFVFSSFFAGLKCMRDVDVIICESPPLFLGVTAVLLRGIKKSRLVFNVSDLWPESVVKLGIITNKYLIQLSTRLEEWVYKHSDIISGQTQGIIKDIGERFPAKPVFWWRNGVDPESLLSKIRGRDWRAENGFCDGDLLFYYGGLIGYAQGLDCIIRAAAKLQGLPKVKFVIIGDGPEKERLVTLKQKLGVNNVFFFDAVRRDDIVDIINSIDVGIVPLKKIDLFLGAIPSKIFEMLCLKKPILLGLQGEAKELFIDEAQAGLAFEPGSEEDLVSKIEYLLEHQDEMKSWGENGYQFVLKYFNRNKIADEFLEVLSS